MLGGTYIHEINSYIIGKALMCYETRFTLIYTGECLVQTCPNTGAVFGRTNHTFGGTLSYLLLLFSTLAYLPSCLVFVGVHYAGT